LLGSRFGFFPIFICSCGFGFMRTSAPINGFLSFSDFEPAMNYFRLLKMLIGASRELGHVASLDELIALEQEKTERRERRVFYITIGHMSVAWGQVEVLLDYANLFLMTWFDIEEAHLPISLKPKIAFFRKYFRTLPELEPYRERAATIVDKANTLKEVRHDIIHGQAEKLTPEGLRRFIRFEYKGKELINKPKNYSLEQISGKIGRNNRTNSFPYCFAQ
jgi:hypothetical protein